MNDRTRNSANCEVIHEKLLEFALGTTSGRDRSRVLEHLETCPKCRAELDSLASVTDALLLLAPEAEPPLGFESRLVERFSKEETVRFTTRRARGVWLAVAALLIAFVGFGVGSLTNHRTPTSSHTAAQPLSARLTSNGITLGQVFITPGRPSWIYMTADDGNWSGVAWCRVTLTSGHVETIGRFTLTRGYGAWAARLSAAGDQVRTAELVEVNGKVIASATLHA